jgi:phenylacetic acid degradation operon negative regulatory protein
VSGAISAGTKRAAADADARGPAGVNAAVGNEDSAGEVSHPGDIALDLFGTYVRQHHPLVWSGGLVELLSEFGFALPACRIALSRLVDSGLIARIQQGRFVHYTITDRGESLLAEGDQRIFKLRSNPGHVVQWTLLMHTLPLESRVDRRRLGRRLRFQGFGRLQDRMWIAPSDQGEFLRNLVTDLGIEKHVAVLIGRPNADIGVGALVHEAWNLAVLADRYTAFANDYGPYMQSLERSRLTDREAFLTRTALVNRYRAFVRDDPDLPDDMLPNPGARRLAIDVFQTVYDALQQASQRHFDAVCDAWFQSGASVKSGADDASL